MKSLARLFLCLLACPLACISSGASEQDCIALGDKFVELYMTDLSEDSRKLPPRVDTVDYEYLSLKEAPMTHETSAYSVAAMKQTIRLAMRNRGTLGGHCKCA